MNHVVNVYSVLLVVRTSTNLLTYLLTGIKTMNENNLVLALQHITSIAVETISIGKSIDCINEKVKAIKGLGFTSIQSGLGKKKPIAGEMYYAAYRAAVAGKFVHLTGKPLTKAIADLRQSINFGLENGGIQTDSNASRAKTTTDSKTTTGAKTKTDSNASRAKTTTDSKTTTGAKTKTETGATGATGAEIKFNGAVIINALMVNWAIKYSPSEIDDLINRIKKFY